MLDFMWYTYMLLPLTVPEFYSLQDVCNVVLNLMKCDNTDFGPIRVQFSGKFLVNIGVTPVQGGSTCFHPRVAYPDYVKDLQAYKRYNVSYTKYIECTVDELLEKSDKQVIDTSASDDMTYYMTPT